jgi:tRNA threonylcarbamoyl adenosine modification protein (Sua5/YciO/YrdC/YwlC family)
LRFGRAEDLEAAVAAARPVVARGGVLLFPTETWYGLGADPARADAVTRVLALKGRPQELALPVLCAGWGQVEALVSVPARWRGRLDSLWPGPLTAVLEALVPLPAGAGPTLAVRIPGHPLLCSLLAAVGPLTGTSANRHGAPPCADAGAALASLAGSPDVLLDGGPTPGGAASTLVDLRGGEATVLRGGPVSWT